MTLPATQPSAALRERLATHAAQLFPAAGTAEQLVDDLVALVGSYRERLAQVERPAMDQRTSYLIAYGDSFTRPGEQPLSTLGSVLRASVGDTISDVHILPMFPWTSDDGFAVVDYRAVDPELGTWSTIEELGTCYDLMFDFVANHVSASSPWFRGWLAGNPRYADYFVSPSADFDTSRVVRPRTSPLVHDYERPDGSTVPAWTTFGSDQVDINAANPAVLVEMTDILLEYLARGAVTIRLDAIGYLWKESGTTCIHLPGTHAIIKMWRAIVDEVAPGARLLTETNVPHADNITYLGDGTDEAHMVYQFPLPPLVLHTFLSGSSERLRSWAGSLEPLGEEATWFNFLASHDGIGMRPSESILSAEQRQVLVDRALAVGGKVSYATAADGTESVYELNVSYLDALAGPDLAADPAAVAQRALAAHAILFSLVGVPAIYYHSLMGSSHDIEGMERSGVNRRINRARLNADVLHEELETSPRRSAVFGGLRTLLEVRAQHPAFSPYAPQEILDLGDEVFAVRRGTPAEGSVLAIVNVSGAPVTLPGVSGRNLLDDDVVTDPRLPADGYVWLAENTHGAPAA